MRYRHLALFFVLILLLSSCSDVSSTESVAGLCSVTVYLLEENGYLIPFSKYVPLDRSPEEAALSMLLGTPENETYYNSLGLAAPLDRNTAFSLELAQDGTATLDFLDWASYESQERESAAALAITQTLFSFKDITQVRFLFHGKSEKTFPLGTPVSGFTDAMPLNPEPLSTSSEGANHRLFLYFPNTRGYLVPVTRYQSRKPSPSIAIEALLKGSELPGLLSCFPNGTLLDSVQLTHDEAILCFSEEFCELRRSVELEQAAIHSLLQTISAFPEITKISIEAGGETYAPIEGSSLVISGQPTFFPMEG